MEHTRNPKDLLHKGEWGESATWELWRASRLPADIVSTAIVLVAVTDLEKGKFVVVENNKPGRAHGLIAGHIEEGETLEEAVRRESLEEGGFVVPELKPNLRLFAYKFIHNLGTNEGANRKYPEFSVMPCYVSVNEHGQLLKPTGDDVKSRGEYTLSEAEGLLKPEDLVIAKEGLAAALLYGAL